MQSKKKTCIFKDIVPIEFTLPPAEPNQDKFKLGPFRTSIPLPPSCNQDNMPLNFLIGHELQERKHWICVYVCVCLSVTLLILALLELYRGFQRILELKRELKREFLRYLNSKVQNCFEIENQEIHLRPPSPKFYVLITKKNSIGVWPDPSPPFLGQCP